MRAGDESGIALILAIGIMIVLTVVVTSVVQFSSAGTRNASRSSASQSAYSLAEAGLNNAFATIAVTRSDTTAIKPQPAYAGDPSSTTTTLNGGYVTWGGTWNGATHTWTIKAIGDVPNPTGPSSNDVTRVVTGSIQVVPPPYSFVSLNNACEGHTLIVRASGQLTVTNAMYINSCDNSHDAFDVFGTGGNISAPAINVVGGWETQAGNTVTVNGTTCPLLNGNPPASQTPGCPAMGQPVVADPYLTTPAPALGASACTSTVYGTAASYSPKQTLSGATTAAQTAIASSGTAVQNGDVVQIDTEQMLVTAGGGTKNLTVQRAYNGTTAALHTSGKEIKKVPVTTGGTAATPAPCKPTGTVTLQPGTYYGGICIGAATGSTCGSVIGGTCSTTGTTANVTLAPGTYIMAGGGFFVCGASTLSAPNVLIYDTQDPTNTTGSGALDQIELNTTGSVSLGPQTSGAYAGLTLFEDRNLGVDPSTNCNLKTKSPPPINEWDIALISMGSGGLNSISGTIYDPHSRSEFAVEVSGTANLAAISSCIFIDGGASTFAFDPNGLFGSKVKVTGQWG